MKRTPLKRKSPLKAKSGLKRTAMKRTAPKKTAAKKAANSEVRWRSEKYLAWVRSLPCCRCGGPGGEAHHIIGVGGMSGMGLTAPDDMAMPVCRACHGEIHKNPNIWIYQIGWVDQTRSLAFSSGFLLPELGAVF